MGKKRELFALILWGLIFSCMILIIEYMFGNLWNNQYMPVRVNMMQGYLEEVRQGIFPQIKKSGNCDHAIGFYILAAYIGNYLNFNAEQIFRASTLVFSISMLIILMFFIYYYYYNFWVAFIVPIIGYICYEDYIFRVKNDVYVAIGIWMVVISVPMFLLLSKTQDIRKRLKLYMLLVLIISFSNIAREHTSLGILLCFLISGIKDPRITSMVSVTDVEVTNDLSYAYIYVSILGGDEESTLLGLKSAVNFIRREVSRSVKLRHTPQIIFKVDESIKNGMYMDHLIKKVNEGATASSFDEEEFDEE